MIKDNQKSLNRFHVVLDAFVTAFSYLLAWFIVIGSGWANLLGKRTLEVGFYFGALLVIIPAYLLLYSIGDRVRGLPFKEAVCSEKSRNNRPSS